MSLGWLCEFRGSLINVRALSHQRMQENADKVHKEISLTHYHSDKSLKFINSPIGLFRTSM